MDDKGAADDRLQEVLDALRLVTEERDRLRVAVDRSRDGVVIVSGDTRPSFVSAAVEQLLGYPPEALVDCDPFELMHEDSRDEMLVSLAEAETTGMLVLPETITVRAKHADGSGVWCEVSIANLLDDPQIGAIVANVRDVTKQRAVQSEIEAERARYLRLIEAIPDVVIRFDRAAEITYLNPAAERFVARATPALQEALDVTLGHLRAVLQDGERRAFEIGFTQDGVDEWYEAMVVAELDGDGQVEGVTLVSHDITVRKRNEAELQRRVITDDLTGVANRVRFERELDLMLSRAEQERGLVAVLYLDVDRFKTINDTWGHDVGDAFLIEVATKLTGVVRSSDVVARIGGDEFAIVLGQPASQADAEQLADRIHEAIAGIVIPGIGTLAGSISIGVSYADCAHPLPPSELVRRADIAMYEAKRTGRHRTVVFQGD